MSRSDHRRLPISVRNTTPRDFAAIKTLTAAVYRDSPTWTDTQLASHHALFPEGQFVAVRDDTGDVVGMAASLIVRWDDYDLDTTWRDFTEGGLFTNHDPEYGHTLYGAEVMVHPEMQGHGIGTALYDARADLTRRLGLWRIRAGARLRDYHKHAATMSAREYTDAVVRGEVIDRTLSFQLHRGFFVLGVVSGYLRHDPESLGYAAVIEWRNPDAHVPPAAVR